MTAVARARCDVRDAYVVQRTLSTFAVRSEKAEMAGFGAFVRERTHQTPPFRKSAPDRSRTCDLRYRKPALYPLSYGGNRQQR